jgi:cysteine desulfurase/selenocysteine lyase
MLVTPKKNKNLDIDKIRKDFPILKIKSNNKPLVFFDNGASSQKPQVVLDKINEIYKTKYANIHRGIYDLSQQATEAYEKSRKKIQKFLNAKSEKEIIFVRGATEGINLVAQSYGLKNFKKGDEIILSQLEHHSNIVPWQLLRDKLNIKISVLSINKNGDIDLKKFKQLLTKKTKLVSILHVSNALGTIIPIKELIDISHKKKIPVLVDGCQSVPHIKVDVKNLDADFYCFSGHKIYGPTGIGILYCKKEYLEKMDPYQGGGEMISEVTFNKTTYQESPHKYEAGTPNIVGSIALGTAIDYVTNINIEKIYKHEQDLLNYATDKIKSLNEVQIIGTSKRKTGIISFIVKNTHPNDVGVILDNHGIAVRTGHHCCQPLMQFYNIPATVRASFGVYNTLQEIDYFYDALKNAINLLR